MQNQAVLDELDNKITKSNRLYNIMLYSSGVLLFIALVIVLGIANHWKWLLNNNGSISSWVGSLLLVIAVTTVVVVTIGIVVEIKKSMQIKKYNNLIDNNDIPTEDDNIQNDNQEEVDDTLNPYQDKYIEETEENISIIKTKRNIKFEFYQSHDETNFISIKKIKL